MHPAMPANLRVRASSRSARPPKLAKLPPSTQDRPSIKNKKRNSPLPRLQIPLPAKPLQTLQIPPRLHTLQPHQSDLPILPLNATTRTPAPSSPLLNKIPSHDLRIPCISPIDLPTVPSSPVTFGANVLGQQADVCQDRVEGVGLCCEG